MKKAPHSIRRCTTTIATLAILAVFASPAWSACAPHPATRDKAPLFRADDGVVYQENLIWQRCSVGQHFDDGMCQGTPEKLSWAAANQVAATAGKGWRLPSENELASLLVSDCSSPATDTTAFPGTADSWYWSSSPNGAEGAWFVDFEQGGGNGATLRTGMAAVRLVRNAGAPEGRKRAER